MYNLNSFLFCPKNIAEKILWLLASSVLPFWIQEPVENQSQGRQQYFNLSNAKLT